MKVTVVYCYPLVQSNVYLPLARRFADTWKRFPPGAQPHELTVVCNGSHPGPMDREPFNGIPCSFRARHNMGWDIGAFQDAADAIKSDMMVCLGAPVHFYRSGWLDRMVEAFLQESPALFGCWGIPYRTCSHIRTTSFWFAPELMRSYPLSIGSTKASRYDFEHGPNCFTNFSQQAGFIPKMVTWDAVYPIERWGEADGSPGKCLLFDQHVH